MFVKTLILASIATMPQTPGPHFSDVEREKVVAFWSEPGRYTVGPPKDADKSGLFVVRLTPEGSTWLWNYDRARGIGKHAPSKTPAPQNDTQRLWEQWIDAKIARERWVAGKQAEKQNLEEMGSTPVLADTVEPPDPGPIPAALKAFAGEPPPFAKCVEPKQHTVVFDDKLTLTYQDWVAMRPRYAYFRYSCGVMSGGDSLKFTPQDEVDKLFRDAGISPFEQKVMKAVSRLEGGFDSINTYDTGFVSVGLIQFACLRAGGGSLGKLLLHFKADDAEAFDRDFRNYGLDVDDRGLLVALDPVTGDEYVGPEAAQKIISEPRLAAVFQRAGKVSREFKIAQIQTAKAEFYPGADVVTFAIGSKSVTAKVGDIFRTEAGMATLMDRKVNTGKLDPLSSVLTKVATANAAKTVADLSAYEWDIAAAMRYRRDFLSDQILAQPYRHGSRTSRHKGARKPSSRT